MPIGAPALTTKNKHLHVPLPFSISSYSFSLSYVHGSARSAVLHIAAGPCRLFGDSRKCNYLYKHPTPTASYISCTAMETVKEYFFGHNYIKSYLHFNYFLIY
jgi:hypothetical protein